MTVKKTRSLVLAKSLFLHGCSHANQSDEISRMLAIHNFDLSVHMVLKCVAISHGIISSPKGESGLRKLWERIAKQNIHLPLRDQILSLHDIRNLVQHAETVPSSEDVTKFKGYVEDFLKEVTQVQFNVLFDELSLANMIESRNLRQKVQEAEEASKNGKYEDTIRSCDEALIKATFDAGDIFGKAGLLTGYLGSS